ncbi:MAG: hypothetical protein OEU09_19265 [Rhodospirillales bacterium]|nr:hypothetical protein [Rhodospirillales bacterium]MDH3792823.1 hypothetical protein [Rhodospirillales bacterium]MDH3913425.1 hypothetical protein [Rhodospirillales bacterium]MDH3970367.1 hypothetical protein [Rhodospirillales bacterium]
MIKAQLNNLMRIAAVLAVFGLTGGHALAGGLVEIEFNAGDFTAMGNDPLDIDNRWWPLQAGTRFVYFAENEDDECLMNEVVVTDATKFVAAGVLARVVEDKEWIDLDGVCDTTFDGLPNDVVLEDTDDWYAQDYSGNIWYLGEDTTEYLYDEDWNLLGTSEEGAWEAGADVAGTGMNAEAGIVMLAAPTTGDYYRQEFYEDEAEDMGKVLTFPAFVATELQDYDGCVKTKEWTRLSPGENEHKYYCRDIGLVLIEELKGKTVIVEAIIVNIAP